MLLKTRNIDTVGMENNTDGTRAGDVAALSPPVLIGRSDRPAGEEFGQPLAAESLEIPAAFARNLRAKRLATDRAQRSHNFLKRVAVRVARPNRNNGIIRTNTVGIQRIKFGRLPMDFTAVVGNGQDVAMKDAAAACRPDGFPLVHRGIPRIDDANTSEGEYEDRAGVIGPIAGLRDQILARAWCENLEREVSVRIVEQEPGSIGALQPDELLNAEVA